jgi:hypothetical protein
MTNWSNVTYSGKTVRITTLNNTPNYWGTLTVIDDIGMSVTSNQFAIPSDTQFSPPTNLNFISPQPTYIFINSSITIPPFTALTNLTATLIDINNNPVNGVPVTLIIDNNPNLPQNCFSIWAMSNKTYPDGTVTFTVSQSNASGSPICPQPVLVHAQAGKLLSPTILISGIS